jgi:hypothetical protein
MPSGTDRRTTHLDIDIDIVVDGHHDFRLKVYRNKASLENVSRSTS